MFFDIVLPNRAVFPLGVALGYLALCWYILLRRRYTGYAFPWLLFVYLLFSTLWNVNLVLMVLNNASAPWPSLTWAQLTSYGLIILGTLYWSFARSFLQQAWQTWPAWLIGLIGLVLAVSLDMGWLSLPAQTTVWANGGLKAKEAGFVMGLAGWALLMGLTFLNTQIQLFYTQNPAHRNRIRYLQLATLFLAAGYSMYFGLMRPYSTASLVITWFGGALAAYTVVVENLVDLSTGLRRVVNRLVVTLVTITVYIMGIYLVQLLLGDFLASTILVQLWDPALVVAVVTAVLLTIVYTPINRVSRRLASRFLFGQGYDYQTVIRNYSQAISNILYLDELVNVALTEIKRTLGIEQGLLFMLDSATDQQLLFRTLPVPLFDEYPKTLSLTKDTPILHRLTSGQPLAQYSLDISPHFKATPEPEREAMKALNLEWFIPILKQKQLLGIFALGSKKSKQGYRGQDLRLLTTLADQTALALENANLVDRLQRNLQETTRMKHLMDNVFDSMDDGVITTDLIGRVTFCNKASETIFQLPPLEECLGKPYRQILPALASTVFPNLIINVLDHEQRYTAYEISSDWPERGRVNLSLNLAPLKDAQDRIQGVTIVADDLTETKRLQAVRDMFKRYVSPAVVDRLPADPSELALGGHRQEVTILFADIRGFTTFSEKLPPEQLVDILNEYLSIAASSILMYEGTLDKFMGDAVMGIFNAPLDQEDHVLRAVRAALAMQRSIADYHHNIGQERGLSFGVGLHVGEAVVGNVGLSDRMDYTAIGDTVNLAKRIQENSPANTVLISEDVYQVVNSMVKTLFYKELKVKGREQPITTYQLQWD